MRYLTKPQMLILRKIQKAGIYSCVGITNDELRIIQFLRAENFVDIVEAKYAVYPTGLGSVQTAETGLNSVRISEAGNAYFAELAIDQVRYRIPLIISIIALMFSGIALYTSSSPQKTEIINTVTIATVSEASAK